MTNLILALFYIAPGTEVKLTTLPKYKDCPATIIKYEEYQDVVYYSLQIQPPCADVRLHNLLETDFKRQ